MMRRKPMHKPGRQILVKCYERIKIDDAISRYLHYSELARAIIDNIDSNGGLVEWPEWAERVRSYRGTGPGIRIKSMMVFLDSQFGDGLPADKPVELEVSVEFVERDCEEARRATKFEIRVPESLVRDFSGEAFVAWVQSVVDARSSEKKAIDLMTLENLIRKYAKEAHDILNSRGI